MKNNTGRYRVALGWSPLPLQPAQAGMQAVRELSLAFGKTPELTGKAQ